MGNLLDDHPDEHSDDNREQLDTYVPPDANKAKGTMAPKKRRARKRLADVVDDGLNVGQEEPVDNRPHNADNEMDVDTGPSNTPGRDYDQEEESLLGEVVGLGPKRKRGSIGPIGMELPKNRNAEETGPKPKRQRKAKKEESRLIIGIDFGTTFSGVAYALSTQPDTIKTFQKWENRNNANQEKVPSVLFYNEDNEIIWGNLASKMDKRIEWFKLLLAKPDQLPADIRNSESLKNVRTRLDDLKKTSDRVIGDYMTKLWEHVMQQLQTTIGGQTIVNSKFRIVLTVPALWDDAMKSKMRKACKQAGMLQQRPIGVGETDLDFIDEPEAAAISTLLGYGGRSDIEDGDSFVVVDCGGGTADLITFKVQATAPKMKLTQLVPSKGGLYGGVHVETRFRGMIMEKLEQLYQGASEVVQPGEIDEIVRSRWEADIRPNFVGDETSWSIRLPDSISDKGVRNASNRPNFDITSKDIEKVCDVIVDGIKGLVDGQVKEALEKDGQLPRYLILVGGFGQFPYLLKYLEAYCEHEIEILQPEQTRGYGPWTAVVHGAVLYGLGLERLGKSVPATVISRKAKASYGIICQEKWDEDKHDPQDKVWDNDQKRYMARDQLRWLVKKGNDVGATEVYGPHTFFKLFRERPEEFVCTIWKSEADVHDLPRRKNDSLTRLCDVNWTPGPRQKTHLNTFRNFDDEDFKQMEYTVELHSKGANLPDVLVRHNGRIQKREAVKVEFEE